MDCEIILQRFDDNFADYHDKKHNTFVVYAGRLGLDDFKIKATATILDYDNVAHDCWLKSCEYVPYLDAYKLKYKPY